MARFATADGAAEIEVGDDVEVAAADLTVEGGVRLMTGPVTRVDPAANVVWVRGIRVDLATARIVRAVGADEPENLTPSPE